MKKTYKEKYFELKLENKYLNKMYYDESINHNISKKRIKELNSEYRRYMNNIASIFLEEKKHHENVENTLFLINVGIALLIIVLKCFGCF